MPSALLQTFSSTEQDLSPRRKKCPEEDKFLLQIYPVDNMKLFHPTILI